MMFLTLGKIKSDGLKTIKYHRVWVTIISYHNFSSLDYDVILVLLVVSFFELLFPRFPSSLITSNLFWIFSKYN